MAPTCASTVRVRPSASGGGGGGGGVVAPVAAEAFPLPFAVAFPATRLAFQFSVLKRRNDDALSSFGSFHPK